LQQRDFGHPGIALQWVEIMRMMLSQMPKNCLGQLLQKFDDGGGVIGLLHVNGQPNGTKLLAGYSIAAI
jgi:hypothetical protein